MLVLALLALSLSSQEPFDSRVLVGRLESQRVDLHIPGLALAVVRDGKLIFAEGFGSADLESGRAANADTLFGIGSDRKSVV